MRYLKGRFDTVFDRETGVTFNPDGNSPQAQEYRNWVLEEGNEPDLQPEPTRVPRWIGFLAAMKGSSIGSSLRGRAAATVRDNSRIAEFRAGVTEASLGGADLPLLQDALNGLLPMLTGNQRQELADLLVAYDIPLVVDPQP